MYPVASFRRRAGHRHGFTLIELLIVIGIIVVLLSLSVAAFAIMFSSRGLRGAVDTTQGAVLKMRERAGATGQPVFLVFEHWKDPIELQGWQVQFDDAPAINDWVCTQVGESIDYPTNVFFRQWWKDDLELAANIGTNIPFGDRIQALLFSTHGDNPNYAAELAALTANDKKFRDSQVYRGVFILTFHPSGAVDVIGRADRDSWAIESATTDGDIVIDNGDSAVYMDLNATTGRIRWVSYEGLPAAP